MVMNLTKLYISGSTDRVRQITAGANKYIDTQFGYDESDYSKNFNVRLNVPEDTKKPTLWIGHSKYSDLDIKCEVEEKTLTCTTHNHPIAELHRY